MLSVDKSTKRVVAITLGDIATASSRYRVLQFIPQLMTNNFSIEVLAQQRVRRAYNFLFCVLFGPLKNADIVWIQKKLLPRPFIWIISIKSKLVFDFDDAIWTREERNHSDFVKFRLSRRIGYTLKKSSLVIVGNHYLGAYASRWTKNFIVLPTVVNAELYPVKSHRESEVFKIGWIGSSVNFRYLLMLQNVFVSLKEKINFELVVIADKDFPLCGFKVVNKKWRVGTEIDDLLSFDVGIMPLVEDEWTLGKCAFKAIQYMAAGIPPIVSSIPGPNCELIEQGVSGYLCNSSEDWEHALLRLSSDQLLRSQLGRMARKTVEDRYRIESIFPELLTAMKAL